MMEGLFFFYPDKHEQHFEFGHPERPERVNVIRDGLSEKIWWDKFKHLEPFSVPDDILHRVHSISYIDNLKNLCKVGSRLDGDTYTTRASWMLALNAAGGAVAVADSIWNKDDHTISKGFALTRPPGHHATISRGMGFCLLNNVAIAAEYLIQKYGVKKIAIIDLDLHHGNGTQDVFYHRDDVFYISTHQYPFYPGSGSLLEIGEGVGFGYTANFPLPPATGDIGFSTINEKFILPILNVYSPEIVLVSYGFDPHWMDPLGHLQLSAGVYGELIRDIKEWADKNSDGKLGLFLEGGYDLDAGRACSEAIVSVLMDEEWSDYLGVSPRAEGNSWRSVVRKAEEIWKF